MFPLPSFLRRAWALRRARRALEDGDIGAALRELAAPALSLEPRARGLREAALEAAERGAARAAAAQDADEVERAIGLVASEDPPRAAALRERLVVAPSATPLARLLAEMRARAARETSVAPAAGAEPVPAVAAPRARPARRFHLAVDDGGELLVACGAQATIGHLRSARADLPFLADVEEQHALLEHMESFHGGGWTIRALGRARILVDGRAIGAAARALADGAEVALAANLAFRFRAPEPASASALLELVRGAECEGARRVLLFVPGAGGTVRIGPSRARHVPVAGLEHEVTLELQERELVVRCAGGVAGYAGGVRAAPLPELALPAPPAELVHVWVGARASGATPFELSLRPSPAPPGGAREASA